MGYYYKQESINISHLVTKFSALKCQSKSGCNLCVKVLSVFDAYHSLGLPMASCDKCEQTLYESDVVIHCPPNTSHHYDGYDLCVLCADKILIKQQKKLERMIQR